MYFTPTFVKLPSIATLWRVSFVFCISQKMYNCKEHYKVFQVKCFLQICTHAQNWQLTLLHAWIKSMPSEQFHITCSIVSCKIYWSFILKSIVYKIGKHNFVQLDMYVCQWPRKETCLIICLSLNKSFFSYFFMRIRFKTDIFRAFPENYT